MDKFDILTLLNSLLVVLLLGVTYLLARFMGDFINKINSIRGIQIGSLLVDDEAPNFREFDQNGNRIISSQLYKTKKTLLLFIKSTCPVCKSILKDFSKVETHYNLNYLVLNIDEVSDDSEVLKLIDNHVIYLKSKKYMDLFSISSVPQAILVNTDGKIDSLATLKSSKSLWNMLINEESLVS